MTAKSVGQPNRGNVWKMAYGLLAMPPEVAVALGITSGRPTADRGFRFRVDQKVAEALARGEVPPVLRARVNGALAMRAQRQPVGKTP